MAAFQWTVASRLRLLSIMIVLSGILGVVGAIEVSKCAKMHELNFLHIKHNFLFTEAIRDFSDQEQNGISTVRRELNAIRQQPIDCLQMIGTFERSLMTLVGTDGTITICERDIDQAMETERYIQSYESGDLPRNQLVSRLEDAAKGFSKNSAEFEPLVERTVNWFSTCVILMVILKAVAVGFAGWVMATSVARDYRSLQIAESALESTNDELKQFVYRTSHDFKSPLLGIKGLAGFVKEDLRIGNVDEAIRNVERVERNCENLEHVVTGTLRVAKSDMARKICEDVDVRQLCEKSMSKLADFADKYHVDLELDYQYPEPNFTTDPVQLSTILDNLLSNAIKYSKDKKHCPTVRVRCYSDESLDLMIRIEDNGIGIPTKHHADVFDMFRQFHTDRADGTGLGLYIVKKSIDRLAGKISMTSSENGTIFELRIPKAVRVA